MREDPDEQRAVDVAVRKKWLRRELREVHFTPAGRIALADGEPKPEPDDVACDWSNVAIPPDRAKRAVSLRLDADVLAFFKDAGARGYQTRINAVLRHFMQEKQRQEGSNG
ncbi:BrnA antitoxin family protein [Allomesorhizobium alhagi]|uniref:BrnA antitoxin family protein n=1 Tax=Allomesorhizobium alhagi TaxID=475067 RepID=UPI0002F9221F|nr:BrnA antitoxin family protein [Mesorhizobium alhagi]